MHNWVDPTGGTVRVRMIAGSTVMTSPTWVATLDFGAGNVGLAYGVDITHHAAGSRINCLDPSFFSDWRIVWFVSTYPPSLTDRVQQAARQAVVWHLSDGANIDTANATIGDAALDAAVLSAYNTLLTSIPAAAPPSFQPGNIELAIDPGSDVNLLPGGESHPFTVRLTKGGLPLAGYPVQVIATFGSLNTPNGVTNVNGEAQFTLTSATPGTALITATASVTLPAGSRFMDQLSPIDKQRLVLAQNQFVTINGSGEKTWVTMPNGIVVRKFNDRNGNGIQDGAEPSLAGWRFTLTTPDGNTFNRTTGTDGNAYFTDLVPAALYGVYTVTEVLQTNWTNVTPLVVTRTRTVQDPWTQWAISYGNAQLSLIKVLKFLDLNMNGVRDTGEPGLAGWHFELRMWDGNDFVAFMGGTTDGTGHVRFTNLSPGLYKVIEFGQVGYTNTTPLERIIEITPDNPGIYEVTFGNARSGSLVVVKAVNWNGVTPVPTQTFTLCITGPSYPSGNCQTIGSAGGSLVWTSLLPGAYTITETNPGLNWTVTGSGVSVNVAGGGGTFTGTITNTRTTPQLGSLQVTKSVDWIGATPNPSRTFQICITGPSYPSGNCQTIGATGGTLTWSNLVPGSYTVTESDPGVGWTVTGSGVTVVAPAGGAGSATITNTLRYGSLQVAKVVDWGTTTPILTQTFSLCITGPTYPSGNCQSVNYLGGTLTWNNLIPGTYTVTEVSPGVIWSVTGDNVDVVVPPGAPGSTTVTNTFIGANLQVTKVVNWNGVTPVPTQTFSICITGPSYPAGNCQTIGSTGGVLTWSNLIPGTYTVTETNPGANWAVTGNNVGIVVAGGGSGTHTITNTRTTPQLGSLQVTKVVNWNGVTPVPTQTFSICITGPSYPAGNCQTIGSAGGVLTWNNLIPGSYTVTEPNAGTQWTVSITGSPVTVPIGGSGSATVTNTHRLGYLEVTKSVNWNGVTPIASQVFTLCITGPSYPTGSCLPVGSTGGTVSWNALLPGTYTVTEVNPGPAWSVTGSGSVAVVTAGGSTAAGITNTRRVGSLQVTKAVNWNGAVPVLTQTFTLCITGPSYPTPNCQTVGASGGVLTWNNLIPGTYTVTEVSPGPMWTVTGSGVAVVAPAGGTGAHTVTNTHLLPRLIVRKSSIPPNGTQVSRNSLITYVLVLTNTGQIPLTNVRLVDTAPLGTQYITGSAVPAPSSPPLPLVWVVPTLGVGSSFTAQFTVRVTPVTGTLAITNSAIVSSDQTPVTETNIVVHPFRETAIQLLSFTATPQQNGNVLVRWVTGAEINTYGFHLYRSTDGNRNNAVRVTDQIILSQGWGQGGAIYQWVDTGTQSGVTYTYWLQETELDGDQLEYGPVSTSPGQLIFTQRLFLPITSH